MQNEYPKFNLISDQVIRSDLLNKVKQIFIFDKKNYSLSEMTVIDLNFRIFQINLTLFV